MGLHSPFGYTGYEVDTSEIFIAILDKLCAYCHTNADYEKGCSGCPAGNLAFRCRQYIMSINELDKEHELYASQEWIEKRGWPTSEADRQRDIEMAQDYKPECEMLRAMKAKIGRITPHPSLYARPHRQPKALAGFVKLLQKYRVLKQERLTKWFGVKEVPEQMSTTSLVKE